MNDGKWAAAPLQEAKWRVALLLCVALLCLYLQRNKEQASLLSRKSTLSTEKNSKQAYVFYSGVISQCTAPSTWLLLILKATFLKFQKIACS